MQLLINSLHLTICLTSFIVKGLFLISKQGQAKLFTIKGKVFAAHILMDRVSCFGYVKSCRWSMFTHSATNRLILHSFHPFSLPYYILGTRKEAHCGSKFELLVIYVAVFSPQYYSTVERKHN
jgi:hypothetical protein